MTREGIITLIYGASIPPYQIAPWLEKVLNSKDCPLGIIEYGPHHFPFDEFMGQVRETARSVFMRAYSEDYNAYRISKGIAVASALYLTGGIRDRIPVYYTSCDSDIWQCISAAVGIPSSIAEEIIEINRGNAVRNLDTRLMYYIIKSSLLYLEMRYGY